jgi:hypothetical protein
MRAAALASSPSAVIGLLRLLHRLTGDPRRALHLTADLVDRGGHLFGGGCHRLYIGGGFLGRRRNRGGKLLRTLRGRRQRAGGGFQLGRGRRHDLDDLADHRFEIACDLVDALAAPDLCIRFHRGRLVGGLLGDQGVLEHLQGVSHLTDLGLLALVRDLGGEVALAERTHRRNDRSHSARDIADDVDRSRDARQRQHPERSQDRPEGAAILSLGRSGRGFRALVVQLDVLAERGVGLQADRIDLAGVEIARLVVLALGGHRDQLAGLGGVSAPVLRKLLVDVALFLRRDERLVGLAHFVDVLGHGLQRLLRPGPRLRIGQRDHVADHDAVGDGAGAQFTQCLDARQPIRLDLDQVGILRAQLHQGERAHGGQRNQQQCNDRDELGADGEFGEHCCSLGAQPIARIGRIRRPPRKEAQLARKLSGNDPSKR